MMRKQSVIAIVDRLSANTLVWLDQKSYAFHLFGTIPMVNLLGIVLQVGNCFRITGQVVQMRNFEPVFKVGYKFTQNHMVLCRYGRILRSCKGAFRLILS